MDIAEAVKLGAEFGALGIIAALFLWFALKRMRDTDSQAIEREQRIATRVTDLEKFINEKLIGLVESSTNALTRNSEVLVKTTEALERTELQSEKTQRAMDKLLAHLEARPCLLPERNVP